MATAKRATGKGGLDYGRAGSVSSEVADAWQYS